MKLKLTILVLGIFLACGVSISFADELTYVSEENAPETQISTNLPTPDLSSTTSIREYVLSEAKKAGVHVAKVEFIVKNESGFDPDAVGDQNIICRNKHSEFYGEPVHARGAWQITRCYWPDVTDAQAHDVVWSTKWALEKIATSKKLCKSLWSTCYRWHKEQGTL